MTAIVSASQESQIRLPWGQAGTQTEVGIGIAVTQPEETGCCIGMKFEANVELEFEFEDAIWNAAKIAIHECVDKLFPEVPAGGLTVTVSLRLPEDWEDTSLMRLLPSLIRQAVLGGLGILLLQPDAGPER